ncbi:MAG: tyrosine-type recombinase/integrase [Thermoguttaceae bacterium]
MASIFQNKKFNSYGVEILINKKRWRLYGFTTRRAAEKFKENLQELQESEKIGGLSVAVRVWLNDLWQKSPEYYKRLVEMGLAEPRQSCGTLRELIEQYLSYPINGLIPKEGTCIARRGACQSLLNFLANQKHSNFKRDERAIQKAAELTAEKITPEIATRFYGYLQKLYAPTTWGRKIKHFKTMFDIAVSIGWIEKNPFNHLKGTSRTNHSRDFFINTELAQKILKSCPNARWRLIFSFARWGGLRMPSEISFLRWSDIFWNSQKIRISVPKKTGRIEQERGIFSQRFIPIFPEIRTALEEFLQENREKAETNDFVFPEFQNSDQSGALLRKQFLGILKKGGIPVWPKLFNNLRATRDTELQETYPLHKVCSWLGHSPQISLKHYTQMTDEDFRQASEFLPGVSSRTGKRPGRK